MQLITALLLTLRLTPGPDATPYKQPQLAATKDLIAMTFGSGNAVFYAGSTDGGRTFSKPVKVGELPVVMVGMRRGPRIAIAGDAILITAIGSNEKAQGDLLAWRSTDTGKSWSAPHRINDVVASAREGLHSTSARDNRIFVTWLDLRAKGMKLYGAVSNDAGKTWSENRLVYESPDGHICECCHPTAYADADGKLYAMWRNWLQGSRDMYLGVSTDEGRTWKAQRLGAGTWPLNGCPMDGGGVSIGSGGKLVSVWRRDKAVFLASPGEPERELGPGKQPVVVATASGPLVVWNDGPALRILKPGAAQSEILAPEGTFVSLAGDGPVVAAWEQNGTVQVQQIGIR